MAYPRFYCPTPLKPHQSLVLPDALAHHAARVLRLKNNSLITLFDGTGGHYDATLHIDDKFVSATLGPHDPTERELPGRITLVQGLASGDKMDWIIEKAVELGVAHIVPVSARRSVLQLAGPRREKRLRHWEKIVQSACEQCGRNRLALINEPISLQSFFTLPHSGGLTLLAHPEAGLRLDQALTTTPVNDITILVGPEGGWADDEIEMAKKNGATLATFGPRILRTATAGLAMAAAISALKGWN